MEKRDLPMSDLEEGGETLHLYHLSIVCHLDIGGQ